MIEITREKCLAAECIIFDFDGTLCDSKGDIVDTLNQVLQWQGFGLPDPKTVTIGPPLSVMIRNSVGNDVAQDVIEAMAVKYRRHYEMCEFYKSPLYPGTFKLLTLLQERKIPLAIATNKRAAATKRIVAKKGIDHFFDFTFSCDTGGETWSKDRMVQTILQKTGAAPRETLFFGDTSVDIITAQNCNVNAVAALYGYGERGELLQLRPDYICRHLSDLIS